MHITNMKYFTIISNTKICASCKMCISSVIDDTLPDSLSKKTGKAFEILLDLCFENSKINLLKRYK